mmetsp:Transcript_24194/g.76077  ORF Transcript_24194/g.76077 Transcript_24194/m.76077 type:complete len:299 (+) Transcript_24194:775-1671(+)
MENTLRKIAIPLKFRVERRCHTVAKGPCLTNTSKSALNAGMSVTAKISLTSLYTEMRSTVHVSGSLLIFFPGTLKSFTAMPRLSLGSELLLITDSESGRGSWCPLEKRTRAGKEACWFSNRPTLRPPGDTSTTKVALRHAVHFACIPRHSTALLYLELVSLCHHRLVSIDASMASISTSFPRRLYSCPGRLPWQFGSTAEVPDQLQSTVIARLMIAHTIHARRSTRQPSPGCSSLGARPASAAGAFAFSASASAPSLAGELGGLGAASRTSPAGCSSNMLMSGPSSLRERVRIDASMT